jgi:hypothetical protein
MKFIFLFFISCSLPSKNNKLSQVSNTTTGNSSGSGNQIATNTSTGNLSSTGNQISSNTSTENSSGSGNQIAIDTSTGNSSSTGNQISSNTSTGNSSGSGNQIATDTSTGNSSGSGNQIATDTSTSVSIGSSGSTNVAIFQENLLIKKAYYCFNNKDVFSNTEIVQCNNKSKVFILEIDKSCVDCKIILTNDSGNNFYTNYFINPNTNTSLKIEFALNVPLSKMKLALYTEQPYLKKVSQVLEFSFGVGGIGNEMNNRLLLTGTENFTNRVPFIQLTPQPLKNNTDTIFINFLSQGLVTSSVSQYFCNVIPSNLLSPYKIFSYYAEYNSMPIVPNPLIINTNDKYILGQVPQVLCTQNNTAMEIYSTSFKLFIKENFQDLTEISQIERKQSVVDIQIRSEFALQNIGRNPYIPLFIEHVFIAPGYSNTNQHVEILGYMLSPFNLDLSNNFFKGCPTQEMLTSSSKYYTVLKKYIGTQSFEPLYIFSSNVYEIFSTQLLLTESDIKDYMFVENPVKRLATISDLNSAVDIFIHYPIIPSTNPLNQELGQKKYQLYDQLNSMPPYNTFSSRMYGCVLKK